MPKALHGTTYVFDYLFAIAKVVCDEGLAAVSYDEMHQIIKKNAINAQVNREIEAGKKWRDYRKKALEPTFMREAADKTIAAMILWGFLERPSPKEGVGKKERRYDIKPRLRMVGEKLSRSGFREARLMVFSRMLQSERESAFGPQLLMRIRNSKISSELESEYNLPAESVIQWSAIFVRSSLRISLVDFKMIISWFQEIGFLNVFDPRILDLKLPQEIYLTAWLATTAELSSFYSRVMKGGTKVTSSTDLNCLKLLEAIEAVRVQDDLVNPLGGPLFELNRNAVIRKNLSAPYSSDLVLVGEGLRFRGLMTGEIREADSAYLLFPKRIHLNTFAETLTKHYSTLRTKWKTPYVWISPLRTLCCRSLMISDEYFDDMLTDIYKRKPEAIEFSKAATGIFRKRVRVFEKPFKLYGNPFRMIRLVEAI